MKYTLCLLCLALLPRMTFAEKPQVIMFVREFTPATGELIGWLPAHDAALMLQAITPQQAALRVWTPGELVEVVWVNKNKIKVAKLNAARDCVPIKQEANVVRVKGALFLITEISLADAKWEKGASVR